MIDWLKKICLLLVLVGVALVVWVKYNGNGDQLFPNLTPKANVPGEATPTPTPKPMTPNKLATPSGGTAMKSPAPVGTPKKVTPKPYVNPLGEPPKLFTATPSPQKRR